MAVRSTIRRTGGSSTLTLPQKVLEMLGWKVGDELRLQISGQKLVLTVDPEPIIEKNVSPAPEDKPQ